MADRPRGILAEANGDLSRWYAMKAFAMSSDGKTVVGRGTLGATDTGFIARLP